MQGQKKLFIIPFLRCFLRCQFDVGDQEVTLSLELIKDQIRDLTGSNFETEEFTI